MPLRLFASSLVALLGLAACSDAPAPEAIVDRAVATHGGGVLDHAVVAFDFRDKHFRITRDGGTFEYVRTYTDSLGRSVREVRRFVR